MKRRLIVFVLFLFLAGVFISGCGSRKMYYFGDYSKTLYAYEKNQNEESLVKHKQELERIISESEAKNMPVPPGIYAELGYINLRANKSKEAVRLFQNESRIYPESKHLMDRLIQSAQEKEDNASKVSDMSTSNDTVSE